MNNVQEAAPGRPRLARAIAALSDRRMGAMLLLAFAAGLPYGAVLGSLNAWLTEEGVTPSAIGTLSLLTLGYSFKYLWAPAFQTPRPLLVLGRLGARRSWLVGLHLAMAALLAALAFTDPVSYIGLVAFIALAIALLSATHDLILDAWRIEVARSDEDKDLMSALYQFGYKSAGFVTGFVALLLAARFGWTAVYILIAAFLLLAMTGALLAPEPEITREAKSGQITGFFTSLPARVSGVATLIVAIGWGIAGMMIFLFVIDALVLGKAISGTVFVREKGPWIVGLTVLLPALVAAVLLFRYGAKATESTPQRGAEASLAALRSTLFRAIFDPLMEMVGRLRWAVILVLLLALTYRFTDAVWGSFAYPFYLGDDFGALGHSLDDVAIASKFFGVIATILGSLIGAVMIAAIGRMPVLLIGAIVAAATNLLYADLAIGAVYLDQFLDATRIGPPLSALADWAATISPEAVRPDQGQRMARLMVTIFAENIAGGFALVAMTAYLTSVVSQRFAVVQYALLASLTMLIGTLGRPWLGDVIEAQGYYVVFIVTFWLGGVAVVLSTMEWARQTADKRIALYRAWRNEAG